MNRLKRWQAEKAIALESAPVSVRLRHFGFWKLLGLMLLLGIAMGILSVHLIPLAVRAGASAPMADKLPFLGFGCGLLIGLAAAVSRVVMQTLQIGLAIPLVLFGLVCVALSFVMSLLWTIAILDVLLIGAVVAVVFVLVLAALGKAFEALDARRGDAPK